MESAAKKARCDSGDAPAAAAPPPRATFPVMNKEEFEACRVTYNDSDSFAAQLRAVLEEQGMAVVEGILSTEECAEFEGTWRRELTAPSSQPTKQLAKKEWWVNAWVHAQGELAWKARLQDKVVETFRKIFGVTDLSCGLDIPKNFLTPDSKPVRDNEQWLHVDQNTLTGLTHECFQGVLYIWPSIGEECSTTVVWPKSHKEDGIYGKLLCDPQAQQVAKYVDDAGVPHGQYIKLNDLQAKPGKALEQEGVAGARRVPVPAGALLLWNSRTTHQGWSGGPRLAVPVCYEPRGRVSPEARKRKLFMAAAGLASTHSPSEGRIHPCMATRRGPDVKMSRPAVRPFCALPPEECSDEEWDSLWKVWEGERYVEELTTTWDEKAFERVLKAEVKALL